MKNGIVLKSTIHGKGLFLTNDVKKGTFISVLQGRLVSNVKTSKNERDASSHPDWIGVGKNTWLDPKPPYRYINHSCNPSAGIRGRKKIHALRNLKMGDEVTLDYSTIESDPFWKMTCKCGSSNCRRLILPVQFLPYTVYKKYLPLIPAYFQGLYKRTMRVGKHV